MRYEPTELELCARAMAHTQLHYCSEAMAISRFQIPSSIVQFEIEPVWSLGATVEVSNDNGEKRYCISVKLGSWLVLGQKLLNPERTGVRYLPDGRVASFLLNDNGVAEITHIEDGAGEICAFIERQNSDLSQNRVNADLEMCILFIIFHEIGHCFFDHAPPNVPSPFPDHSRAVEHQADLFALRMLLAGLRNKAVRTRLGLADHQDCRILISTGRAVSVMLGAFSEQECFRSRHESHPPVGDRIAYLVGAIAFLDVGYTDYEREGLLAGLMEGLESLPHWYRRTELESGGIESHIENIHRVFDYYQLKDTDLKRAILGGSHRASRAKITTKSVIKWIRNFIWQNFKILFP